MDPTWAATVWKQHIQPYCDAGYKCATPAMSSRPNGFDWMKTFMSACSGCSVITRSVSLLMCEIDRSLLVRLPGCSLVRYRCGHSQDVPREVPRPSWASHHSHRIRRSGLLSRSSQCSANAKALFQNFNGGAQASMGDIWSFMSSVLSWVDETDWMAGACPFGRSSGRL